ncbi:MAG: hypothetical protein ACP5NV_05955 [Candidatus Woesearchaeota archaeon]
MKDGLKSVLTHGLSGIAGFFLGKKTSDSSSRNKYLRDRLIPAIVISYAIAYTAINLPKELFDYAKTTNNNETVLKNKALDKGINIFDENNGLQKELDLYKNELEKKTEEIERLQELKLDKGYNYDNEDDNNDISSRVSHDDNSYRTRSTSTSRNSAGIDYILFDKSEQSFYVNSDGDIVQSGDMIFNGSGKPPNGTYSIKEIKSMTGDLYPGFIKLEGVIGISGAGDNNQFQHDINAQNNKTKNGFRISNNDFSRLASVSYAGLKVVVRE